MSEYFIRTDDGDWYVPHMGWFTRSASMEPIPEELVSAIIGLHSCSSSLDRLTVIKDGSILLKESDFKANREIMIHINSHMNTFKFQIASHLFFNNRFDDFLGILTINEPTGSGFFGEIYHQMEQYDGIDIDAMDQRMIKPTCDIIGSSKLNKLMFFHRDPLMVLRLQNNSSFISKEDLLEMNYA